MLGTDEYRRAETLESSATAAFPIPVQSLHDRVVEDAIADRFLFVATLIATSHFEAPASLRRLRAMPAPTLDRFSSGSSRMGKGSMSPVIVGT